MKKYKDIIIGILVFLGYLLLSKYADNILILLGFNKLSTPLKLIVSIIYEILILLTVIFIYLKTIVNDFIDYKQNIKYYIEPAKSTEFNFTVKETILSNSELTEKTRDKNWVYQNYKVEWQYYLPQDGIETMITVARGINFIKEGIYKVRVKITASDGTVAFSNWIDVKTSNYKKALSYTVTGSFTGIVGADPELVENAGEGDNGFNVSVPDEVGYYLWEALETDGIIITELGLVSFTKPGTYHVRIVSGLGDYVSDWYEITARYPYTPQQPSFVPSSTSSTTTSVPSIRESASLPPILTWKAWMRRSALRLLLSRCKTDMCFSVR